MEKALEISSGAFLYTLALDQNGKCLTKDFDFNKALHDLGDKADPKAVAKEYLQWCEENGYTPKFAEFAGEENYYKLLEDFTLYDKDGKYVPQREVRAVFPKDGNAFGSMKDLIEAGLQEDAIVEGKRDRNLSAIVDEIQKTLPKNEAEISEEQVAQADRDLEANEMYSLRGVNKDGIEVYETSEDVKKLSYNDRKQRFLDIMRNEYRGRTAKFIRNGHAYYATFDDRDINKNIYGDKLSDIKGWKAKINTGADGSIFELVENAKYDGSKPEKGKKIAAHQGVGYWDYFIKTVQIDNNVFDLVANVRKKTNGAFVYSIQLNENKKIKASPPLGLLSKASSGEPNASGNMVSQPADEVKNEMHSLRNQQPTTRDILSAIDLSTRNKTEQHHLGNYQDYLSQLAEKEPRLAELNSQIKELYKDRKNQLKWIRDLEELMEDEIHSIRKEESL